MFNYKAGEDLLKKYLFSHYFYKKGGIFKIISHYYRKSIILKFSCYISPKSEISASVCFPHPCGIVIGDGVKIGSSSTIYQNVTLGAMRAGEGKQGLYPSLADNVTIYAGAVVLGGITIEKGAVVGANAVVLNDVIADTTVVGVPAKEIRK